MNTQQAAKFIGCSINHIRTLIRQGKLHATKVHKTYGYVFDIDSIEVGFYSNTKQKNGGFPRGQKRKSNKRKAK